MAKGKYAEWLTGDKLLLLEAWARDGLTDEQLAHNIGISVKTLYEWKNKYSEFSEAIKKGKEVVDILVENALLKTATGYHETVRKPIKVKIVKQDGHKKIEEEHIEYVEEDVYIPGNVTAQIYWLKNRKPEQWREKPQPTDDNDKGVVIIDDFR